MKSGYKVDPNTGALIFQKSPEEKNLQEYLKSLNKLNSNISYIVRQNNTIIEQNNKIIQLLKGEEVISGE